MSAPETDEEEVTAHQRSALAAIGSRKSLFSFFRRDGADADEEEAPSSDRRIVHSMLESLAEEAGSEVAEPASTDSGRPIGRGMLESLADEAGPADHDAGRADASSGHSMLSLSAGPSGPRRAAGDPSDSSPLIAHSTLGELAGLEEHPGGTFPIERAILISLFAHVLLLVFLIVMPAKTPSSSKGDLFAALMQPKEKDDTPIPVVFREAPGPARPNPKRSELSDADRRAGGGDAAKPKAASPYMPPSSGIAGLAPGPRSPRVPGSEVPARKGATAEAERKIAQQSAPDETKSSPTDFPSAQRPPSSIGPRETAKLAGLDSAIRDAARGAVGGEGGAPDPNPGGGFVDSGPISFDTTWYDWGAYAAEMVRRIKLHWDVPELARLGWKGRLTVRFYILADGRVADAKIIRGSGIPPFDFAAFQAITKSSPFRPLPADLHEEREGVTVTFFYNLRPEDEAGGAR